jgi:two-component system, cell cycle sensor histidine kinase and response regulator CckA
MDNLKAECDFYRRQSDELGSRVLQLQEDLTRAYGDAKRSRTTTAVIRRTYELINHDVKIEQIQRLFLQVILSTMSVDRAMLMKYDHDSGVFIPQCILGFESTAPPADQLNIPDSIPEFVFTNSRTELDSSANALRDAISTPFLLWSFNSSEDIALLVGNETEDRVFRLPFEAKDRVVIENSLSVFIDIVRRKEAEIAFLESEGRYRKLVESSPESIFVCCDGKIVFANNSALKLLGMEHSDDVIGKDFIQFINPEDYATIQSMEKKTLEDHDETPLMEVRFNRTNGSSVDTEVVAIPFVFQEKSAVQIVAIDISERKQMEKELINVQKIESLGILAGGIAHDFNNILTGILGNIELAIAYSNPEREEYRFLDNAHSASNRAKELTHKLLTFSKGGVPLTESATLSGIITDSVDFVLSGSSIKYDFTIPDDLWPVDIDIVQFRQVIENLTINANQAMPNGGTFTIHAENVNEDARELLPLRSRKYIKLTIKDQGIGISDNDIPNIFDPYFTTKDGGSGLGLATTYSIIKKHNGSISVSSEIGVGTTFTIYVPASDEEPSKDNAVAEKPKTGQGKILVMDDDEVVRLVAVQMLETLGFTSVTANDGNEAIKYYMAAYESGDPFDGVIIDLTIRGGMCGEETINKLLELDPEIKAIVSSGYSNSPVMANYREYGFSGIIKKPYNLCEISECLSSLIDLKKS